MRVWTNPNITYNGAELVSSAYHLSDDNENPDVVGGYRVDSIPTPPEIIEPGKKYEQYYSVATGFLWKLVDRELTDQEKMAILEAKNDNNTTAIAELSLLLASMMA